MDRWGSTSASLEKLAGRPEDLYFSATVPEIPDAPRYVRFLIRHRQAREASILHRLAKGEAGIQTMVRAIYISIDPRQMNAAGYLRPRRIWRIWSGAAWSRPMAIR